MKGTIPAAFVMALVRWVAPRHRADEIVADLADDYARVCTRRSAAAAHLWLFGEGASLAAAYLVARLGGLATLARISARDVSLVVRGLRRGPLAALGAAALLSTGLVAVLITVGLSETLLFRQVSAVHGSALRRIGTLDRQGRASLRLSYPELETIRQHVGDAARVSAVNMQPVVIGRGAGAFQTMAEAVDGQYLALVGATPVLGRMILSADDRPAAQPVAAISERLWQRHFGGAAGIIGQRIDLNGAPFTVAGILRASASSSFLGASVDAWIPIAHADPLLNGGWRTNIRDRWFIVFALPAEKAAPIDARLDAAAVDLVARDPEAWRDRRLQTSDATVVTGSQRGAASMLAGILSGLALLILAAASANLGGVFLARAAIGRKQAAIHLAIGSSRAAVIRRHAIEGALIGLAGAALALAVYAWVRLQLADVALLPTLTLRLDLPLTPALVLALSGAGVLAGVALATAPALWSARVDLADALRDSETRVSGGRGAARLRQLLVSGQVCLALTLMVGAVRFTESLDARRTTDLGVARDRLLAMDFDVEPAGATPEMLAGFARAAVTRAATVPGVVSAAMSNRAPIDQSTPSVVLRADRAEGTPIGDATFYLATPAYFDTVGVRMLSGRAFTETECNDASDVAVVNRTLATLAWPTGDPIGRAIYLEAERKTLRVIGVAADSKYRSIDEAPRPHFYRPTAPRLGLTLLVRTSADPRGSLGIVQKALDEIGPGVIGFFPRTLDDHLAIELLPIRAAMSAATALGTLALAFCGVGLYGLVSWFVTLRRREIGVRMALGASPGDIRWLVMRQTANTALPGLAAGVVLALGLGVVARAAFFGVGLLAPTAWVISVALVGAIVVLAAYVPARRATRVDPATVLK